MEIDEIKNIWNEYDKKLERNWQLNLHLLRQTNLDKAKSKLRFLMIFNISALLLNVFTAIVYVIFIIKHIQSLHFVMAAAILLLWSFLIGYCILKQIKFILEIDYSAPVMAIQKMLISLRLSIFQYFRLSILVIPFYTAYIIVGFELFLDFDIFLEGNKYWWMGQLVLSASVFLPFTIWLFIKLRPKYENLAWVKWLIRDAGGKQVSEAIEFLHEIERFEKMEKVS